jgi:hypothetical protein
LDESGPFEGVEFQHVYQKLLDVAAMTLSCDFNEIIHIFLLEFLIFEMVNGA